MHSQKIDLSIALKSIFFYPKNLVTIMAKSWQCFADDNRGSLECGPFFVDKRAEKW